MPCSQSISLQPEQPRALMHARTHLAFLQGWGICQGGGTRLEKEGRGLAAGQREQLEAIGEGGRIQGTPDRLEGPRRGAEAQGRRAGAHGRACSRVPGVLLRLAGIPSRAPSGLRRLQRSRSYPADRPPKALGRPEPLLPSAPLSPRPFARPPLTQRQDDPGPESQRRGQQQQQEQQRQHRGPPPAPPAHDDWTGPGLLGFSGSGSGGCYQARLGRLEVGLEAGTVTWCCLGRVGWGAQAGGTLPPPLSRPFRPFGTPGVGMGDPSPVRLHAPCSIVNACKTEALGWGQTGSSSLLEGSPHPGSGLLT